MLEEKGEAVWTVDSGTSVFDSLKLMAEKNIGALVVVDNNRVVGIFSERDYARKVILSGHTSHELNVRDVMSTNVVSVNPVHTIDHCMACMTERHIRHLPVMEKDNLVGLISIGDVVKSIIEEQRSTITHLEDYITGKR